MFLHPGPDIGFLACPDTNQSWWQLQVQMYGNGTTSIMFRRVAIVLPVIKGEAVSESLGGRQASLQEPSNIFRAVLLNNQYCYEKHFPPNSCIDLIGKRRVEKTWYILQNIVAFSSHSVFSTWRFTNFCFLNTRWKEQYLQNIKQREYTISPPPPKKNFQSNDLERLG